jgi:hypothetical protein
VSEATFYSVHQQDERRLKRRLFIYKCCHGQSHARRLHSNPRTHYTKTTPMANKCSARTLSELAISLSFCSIECRVFPHRSLARHGPTRILHTISLTLNFARRRRLTERRKVFIDARKFYCRSLEKKRGRARKMKRSQHRERSHARAKFLNGLGRPFVKTGILFLLCVCVCDLLFTVWPLHPRQEQ